MSALNCSAIWLNLFAHNRFHNIRRKSSPNLSQLTQISRSLILRQTNFRRTMRGYKTPSSEQTKNIAIVPLSDSYTTVNGNRLG